MRYAVTSLPISSILSSAAGRNGYFLGVTWLLASRPGGSPSVAMFLLVGAIAELATNRIGGMIIDQFDARAICIACDIGRLGAAASIGAALFSTVDVSIVAIGSIAVYSVFDRTYLSAMQSVLSALPQISHAAPLVSVSYLAMQIGNLTASLAVGWLISSFGEAMCIGFVASCLLISLICMVVLAKSPCAVCARTRGADLAATADKSNRLETPRKLTILGLQYGLLYTMGMLLSVLAASYVRQGLNGSAVDYGAIEAAWASGAIIGALVSLAGSRTPIQSKLIIHVLLGGVATGILFITSSTAIATVGMALAGICYNLARVFMDQEILRVVHPSGQGFARARVHSICVALSLVTYAALAIAGDRIAPNRIFGAFAALMLTIAVVWIISSFASQCLPPRRLP